MRDRDRTAATDLLLEQRHDRTGRSEYVAEAHHAEARLVGALLQGLQHELGQALGRTHDVCRIDRLVGRDQHERFNTRLERRLGGVPRTDHVVVNALDHVVLDDRHVLVGGGVVDRLYAEGGQDLAHPVAVMRVAQERHDLDRQLLVRRNLLQLPLDLVERQLRHLEQHQAARAQADDLPAQLRADGAPGPGDQDALTADARAEQFGVGRYRIASQQVTHFHIAQLVDLGLAGNQVREIRERLNVHPKRLQLGQDLAPPATGGGRQRQQDPVYLAPPHQLREAI